MNPNEKPRPKISNYVTLAGEQRLREELDYLWRIERPKVTQAVSEAAAMGDRSENAEYIYGKKRLREIDRRVRHLRKRLELLTVVNTPPTDMSKIYFGAWVTLEDEEGTAHRFRLVGPDEIGEAAGYISIDAPLGRALLGKSADTEISIQTPKGHRLWYVVSIQYEGTG
jgi:transcription elongation factor GreB